MVALNHAVAVAMAYGPAAGLDLLDKLAADSRMVEDHRTYAVRAHLLELAGRPRGGPAGVRGGAPGHRPPQQRYLNGRAARLTDE